MVVDSSALIAILQMEPEAVPFSQAIDAAGQCYLAAPTYVEAAIVIESRLGAEGLLDLKALLDNYEIAIVPFTKEHAETALLAFRRYGKGRHQARLNMGDCNAYALAKDMNEPLLFKGNDFRLTDITPALMSH
jgi:ribonuclease VapC